MKTRCKHSVSKSLGFLTFPEAIPIFRTLFFPQVCTFMPVLATFFKAVCSRILKDFHQLRTTNSLKDMSVQIRNKSYLWKSDLSGHMQPLPGNGPVTPAPLCKGKRLPSPRENTPLQRAGWAKQGCLHTDCTACLGSPAPKFLTDQIPKVAGLYIDLHLNMGNEALSVFL